MNIELKLSRKLFNDVYYPMLLDYSHRYEVYYGGAGSGKSHFVFQKVVVKALNEKRKILVVRKTAKSNLNSTFQMTIDTLSKFQVLKYCQINKTTLTITLPNESQFLFYGIDDSEKLKSIAGITDIVCEEATEISLDDATQLDLRLRSNADNLQVFYMLNPVSKSNWVFKRWFSPDAVIGADTFILKTTYKDNRFLPTEYIQSLLQLARVNPTYYKIYVEGEFCSLDKLIFSNWKVEAFDIGEKASLQLLVGLDFGFTNDPTALIASLLDESNKCLYVFREWGGVGYTNQQIANMIKNLGFSKSVIVADSAEPKSVREIKDCGIQRIKESVKGKDSVLYGIQKLQQYQIIVHPSCENIIMEFENYSWQKGKDGEYTNKPIDAFNHYIDALRYSLQCINDGKLKTLNKSVLGL